MRAIVICLVIQAMLPAVCDNVCAMDPVSDAPVAEAQPWIRFAGGAVEFQLPRDWNATEVPLAREVHVVLSPTRRGGTSRVTTGRIWLACHAAGTVVDATKSLADLTSARVASLTHNHAKIVRSGAVRVADQDGVMVAFVATHPDGTKIRGTHLLVRLGGGVAELHMVAPADEFEQVNASVDALLRTVALSVPAVDPASIVPHAADASKLLGAWKAIGSRLFLDAHGNIAIESDRPTVLSVSAPQQPNVVQSRSIRGRFIAEADLIQVTWADGSRLNYRWRLAGGELLLTDHDGNVSQLRRLVH